MAQQYENFIGGKWLASKSGKTFENRNPANTDDLIGLFPASTARGCRCRGCRGQECVCGLASGAGAQARRNSLPGR